MVNRGSVGKAREGAGRLSDTVGHSQAVRVEQGAAHGEVGELCVKVPQVGGAALWRMNDPLVSRLKTQRCICLWMDWWLELLVS